MTAPVEIFKFCLTCRRETLHRLVSGISSANLYSCSQSCGAPARLVSDPESSTPAAKELEKNQETWREETIKDSEDKIRRWKKGGRAEALDKAVKERNRRMPKTRKEPPAETAATLQPGLIYLIDNRVTLKLKELAPSMSREQIEDLIKEQIIKQLGLPSSAAKSGSFKCPRGVHKGPHGKKCREAAEAAA